MLKVRTEVERFPLYDLLCSKLEEARAIVPSSVCSSIFQLKDNRHLEIIFILIYHHHLLNGGSPNTIPFAIKRFEGGKGVTCLLGKLPVQLQQIIALYVSLITERK